MSSASKQHKAKGFHDWHRSGKELKNTFKCRGLHFYNSVDRRNNKRLSKEEAYDRDMCVEQMENKYSWEYYCGSCDNFDTDCCPFKNKINADTWWPGMKCKEYMN